MFALLIFLLVVKWVGSARCVSGIWTDGWVVGWPGRGGGSTATVCVVECVYMVELLLFLVVVVVVVCVCVCVCVRVQC